MSADREEGKIICCSERSGHDHHQRATIERFILRKQDACLQIPMTLARDTGRPLQGGSRQPCLFQVYGAYGMKLEADYCPATFDLLKRGWTLAFAHVRGGGELGRRWHHAGRQLGKLKAIQVGCFLLEYWCPVLYPQLHVAD